METSGLLKLILFGQSFFNDSHINRFVTKIYTDYLKSIGLNSEEVAYIVSYLNGEFSAKTLYDNINSLSKKSEKLLYVCKMLSNKDPFESVIEFERIYNLQEIYDFGIGCLNAPGYRLYESPLFKTSSFFSINDNFENRIYVFGTNIIYELDKLTLPISNIIEKASDLEKNNDINVCINTRDYAIVKSSEYEGIVCIVDSRYTFDSLLTYRNYYCKLTTTPNNVYPLRLIVIMRRRSISEYQTLMRATKEMCQYIRSGYKVKPHFFLNDVTTITPHTHFYFDNIARFSSIPQQDVFLYIVRNNISLAITIDKGVLKRYVGKEHFKLLSLLDSKYTVTKLIYNIERKETDNDSTGKRIVAVQTCDGWMVKYVNNFDILLAGNLLPSVKKLPLCNIVGKDFFKRYYNTECVSKNGLTLLLYSLKLKQNFRGFFQSENDLIIGDVDSESHDINKLETVSLTFDETVDYRNDFDIKTLINSAFDNITTLNYKHINGENGIVVLRFNNFLNKDINMFALIGNGWNRESEASYLLHKLFESSLICVKESDGNVFYNPLIIVRELQIYFYKKY